MAKKMISTVMSNLTHRPRTRLYPAEQRQLPPGARGQIEFDMTKCVFCTLCAKRCPADAITVDRKGKTLVFNLYRCIVCESCREGCAKEAIVLLEHWREPSVAVSQRTYRPPDQQETLDLNHPDGA
jgi:ech hydrogenase subunit F